MGRKNKWVDLPKQGKRRALDRKDSPKAGPSRASQAVYRDGGASAEYADDSEDLEDNGEYGSEEEGKGNETDDSMTEEGKQNTKGITRCGNKFMCKECGK